MTYDREEWRRPWRAEPDRSAVPHSAGGSAPSWSPSQPWPTASGQPAPEAEATEPWPPSDTTHHTSPRADERLDAPEPTPPLSRYPQPPPEGFDDSAAGPGSPFGSVRPPDTTGTVDPPRPRRRGGLGWAVAALFGAVLGTTATLAIMLPQDVADEPGNPSQPSADISAPSIEVVGEDGGIVPAVAEAVTPSVVTVDVGGPEAGPRPTSLGSGVIYTSDGYIITNHHVIEAALDEEIPVTVRLASGDILEAEIIGSDELNDLAVVKVDRDGLPAINFRPDDEPLRVGETVIAVGSPFGLETSVTAGIISALNRQLRIDEVGTGLVIPSVIQTDAAINPGNSGGALVDAEGRLVGINTAIMSQTGTGQGVGFAVSFEQTRTSADQLIEQGFVRHPLLGIAGQDVTPDLADELDLPASRGAVIEEVQPDTGASDVDLRPGDVIVEFDGEPLATMDQLVAEVRRMAPGDEVDLVIIREGERMELSVTLSERPR